MRNVSRVIYILKSPDTTPAHELKVVLLVRALMIWKTRFSMELPRNVAIILEPVEPFNKSGYDLERMEPEENT
jgi:hypothetical protein